MLWYQDDAIRVFWLAEIKCNSDSTCPLYWQLQLDPLQTLLRSRSSCSRSSTWYYVIIVIINLSEVRLSPLGTAPTSGLLYQPQMIDDGDCGATGVIKIGWVNRNTQTNPDPQIPHDLTRVRPRAAAVGSQRLTAWAVARSVDLVTTRLPLFTCFSMPRSFNFTSPLQDIMTNPPGPSICSVYSL
jgi:hypothetical protein